MDMGVALCPTRTVRSSSALWLEGTCLLSLPSSRFSESLGDSGWLTVIQTEEGSSTHQRGWSVRAQVSVVFSGDLINLPKQSQIYNSLSRKHGCSKYQVFPITISTWTYFKSHQDKSIILIYKRKIYFTDFTHWGNQILQERVKSVKY